MFNFAKLDPANVPTPLAGRTISFIGLDGVLRTMDSNRDIVTYQTGLSPEDVQDIIGQSLVNSTTISFIYDDVNNVFRAALIHSGVDHGQISGLGDDDHPHYFNQARGDARYYTKALIEAGQLDNRYYTETEVNTLLNAKINNDRIGAALGVAGLDGTQKLYSANIPSGIDHNSLANKGAKTHAEIDSHLADINNPHGTTKGQVGLGNVDNTADLDKPISNLTQNALDGKSDTSHGHAIATPSVNGFMSSADKSKLDGIISDVIKTVTTALTNTSNVTLQAVNELAIPVIAGKRYRFKYEIAFDTAATNTGIGLSIGGTATGTLRGRVEAPISNAAGTANKFSGPITALNGVVTTTGVGTASTQYIATVEGIFTASTSGLIYPQFRSEVNGSQVRVNVDSMGSYTEY